MYLVKRQRVEMEVKLNIYSSVLFASYKSWAMHLAGDMADTAVASSELWRPVLRSDPAGKPQRISSVLLVIGSLSVKGRIVLASPVDKENVF